MNDPPKIKKNRLPLPDKKTIEKIDLTLLYHT